MQKWPKCASIYKSTKKVANVIKEKIFKDVPERQYGESDCPESNENKQNVPQSEPATETIH